MTARLIAVRPYVRSAPVPHPNFNSAVHQALRKDYAIKVMEREIERSVTVDISLSALGRKAGA